MPSFPATDEEWTDILAYFNTISVKESKDLHKMLDPVFKYVEDERKAAKNPATQPKEIWPGDDWYMRSEFATAAERLRRWAIEHKQMAELQFDPAKNTAPGELGRNYRTALFKARFTMDLYDSPYPFVDRTHPQMDEARMKLGEEFFHQMQCLSCHQLGDPNAAGVVKDPKGPNLTLTASRLSAAGRATGCRSRRSSRWARRCRSSSAVCLSLRSTASPGRRRRACRRTR